MARGRPTGGDDVRARTTRGILLLFFFFFLLFLFFFFFPLSPSIDCRRPKTTTDGGFWRYRPIAGGPCTGNLADRYVPPGTGDTNRYGNLGLKNHLKSEKAGNNGDAASRGGDWRGATIVAGDGCDCGEEVGQHWIRQLAATMVAMQGKEGTIESKGRRGCSDSDSKEAAIGKKGQKRDGRGTGALRQQASEG
ncbi:hypothetical protein B296_00052541 [Ensete ventricosum]|uniref:Uncharacterized protein n=1 Tax=Ensete ventricosum TaxID=4639 RepID=A0A426XHU5_ENSVE|nr:hypothetical protein B296_00052541 [Ensete ventricosum]